MPGRGSQIAYRGSRLRPLRGAVRAAVGPVVVMVSVACTGPMPGLTDFGLTEQPIPAFVFATAQLKATAALKPFCGVTVMVDEAELPGLTAEGVATISENPGGATFGEA